MPYIVLWANGEEIDRLELKKPLLIGRSAECELPLRDILLSRRHCVIEPSGSTWRVRDLQSRNGTFQHGKPISQLRLRDGVTFRIGRVKISFHEGAFVPATQPARRHRLVRPADPHEALASTVAGMTLDDSNADVAPSPMDDFPIPRPRPTEDVMADYARRAGPDTAAAVAALPTANLVESRQPATRLGVRRLRRIHAHLDPADPLAAIAEPMHPVRIIHHSALEAFKRRMLRIPGRLTMRLPDEPVLADMVVAGAGSLAVLFVGLLLRLV